jgi:prevent-host-death family protein
MRWDLLKTTTATELRAKLASVLKDLEEGPVLVLSHSRPVAVLVEPDIFDAIMEKIELLEDLLDGRRAMGEYLEDRQVGIDAEEVFDRLGH